MLYLRNTFLLSCLLFLTAPVIAQEPRSSTQRPANEVEALRRMIEDEEAKIEQLKTTLQLQSDLIQKQQRLLEELQQKVNEAGRPTLVPAALGSGPSASTTIPAGAGAATSDEKAVSTVKAKSAQSVETGNGKIRFNGLLQGWYQAGDGGFHDTFRMRRSELKFVGEITPRAKWTIMIDPARALSTNNTYTTINGARVLSDTSVNQGSRILQDAFITINHVKGANLHVGQFKIPLSLEGLQSSAALDTVERALFITDRARGGAYGDVRDIGAMMQGTIRSAFDYQLGFFNGSGENQNDLDRNDQKAIAGRFVVRPPFIRGLQIGGSGVWGNGSALNRPRRDRTGAELLFVQGPFRLKSELMAGKDGDISRMGYYAHLGYKINPKVETVVRFDSWDPNTRLETSSTTATERDYLAGLNYYITENNVKLQFNYVRKTFGASLVPSRNSLLVNLQTSW